jgi:hypothetical protein
MMVPWRARGVAGEGVQETCRKGTGARDRGTSAAASERERTRRFCARSRGTEVWLVSTKSLCVWVVPRIWIKGLP